MVFLRIVSFVQPISSHFMAFTMPSNLHIWEVLIALIILNSHFQFYAISLSFSPGILAPLTANSTTKGSSSLLRLSTGGSSTPLSPFQNSPSPSTNRTTSIHTDTRNGDFVPRITPASTSSFQSSATSHPPMITINSQSSPFAPSFIVPNVTSTISISLNTNVPQSITVSAPVISVTNPSDPSQVVGFKTLEIPESERRYLPSVTDAAPVALVIPGIGLVLLFPNFIIVFPVISALPSWLSL